MNGSVLSPYKQVEESDSEWTLLSQRLWPCEARRAKSDPAGGARKQCSFTPIRYTGIRANYTAVIY